MQRPFTGVDTGLTDNNQLIFSHKSMVTNGYFVSFKTTFVN